MDKKHKPLTPTELEVLKLSAEGYVVGDIAVILGNSAATIAIHRHNLFRKLDAGNIAAAVYIGVKTGIIE